MEKPVSVDELVKGDVLVLRQGEILPTDALLLSENTQVDYSYITGEAIPVAKSKGDHLYAGARIEGGATRLSVCSSVDQSYLSSLWTNQVFNENKRKTSRGFTDRVSQHFQSPAILLIALAAAHRAVFSRCRQSSYRIYGCAYRSLPLRPGSGRTLCFRKYDALVWPAWFIS
ncbi:MAG: hypothetical protein U5L96_14565 [Owenweeksia sp.]|nr:hypothetical protein [Owenweeksia sp.]